MGGAIYVTSVAKANRFFSPPEMPLIALSGSPIKVSAHLVSPSSPITS
jgi:hypothetical protein